MTQRDTDAGAKRLAEFIGHTWDGLRDGRISDMGFPMWAFDGVGQKHFQGGKQDLRDVAAEVASLDDGLYTWCAKDDCVCYWPECRAHGCIDSKRGNGELTEGK